jgi:hypothetical protein
MTTRVSSTEQKQGVKEKTHKRSEFGAWLDTAMPLDGALISAEPEIMQIVDDLFPEILDELKTNKKLSSISGKKSQARINYACKVILFNLYLAYLLGIPVRYSRRKAYYSSARRYGKLYFKYQRVIAIIDTFEELGLIKCKIGKNSQTKRHRRQSRMWASPKLIELFEDKSPNPLPVHRAEREEHIELRRKDKTPTDYSDTNEINQLRANVESYNKFISAQRVELNIDGTATTNMNSLKQLVGEVLKGNATVKNLTLENKDGTHQHYHMDSNSTIHKGSTQYQDKKSTIPILQPVPYSTNTSSIYTSISGTFLPTDDTVLPTSNEGWILPGTIPYGNKQDMEDLCDTTFAPISSRGIVLKGAKVEHPLQYLTSFVRKEFRGQKYKRKQLRTEKFFSDFNISNLHYRVNNTDLYRVFNNDSFKQGGRFYGATYQQLSEKVRSGLLINGEPTVELDYSAHHIRMSYHLLGIDYRDDPYLALSDDPGERNIMKRLLLVAINADTEKKAIVGFRGAVWKDVDRSSGILTDKSIKKMLTHAKEVHAPIAKYIHSGKGRRLQNRDSQVTEGILLRMMNAEIPCLPVHDSYIVPKQYGDKLKEVMVKEYEKALNFTPIIK